MTGLIIIGAIRVIVAYFTIWALLLLGHPLVILSVGKRITHLLVHGSLLDLFYRNLF